MNSQKLDAPFVTRSLEARGNECSLRFRFHNTKLYCDSKCQANSLLYCAWTEPKPSVQLFMETHTGIWWQKPVELFVPSCCIPSLVRDSHHCPFARPEEASHSDPGVEGEVTEAGFRTVLPVEIFNVKKTFHAAN